MPVVGSVDSPSAEHVILITCLLLWPLPPVNQTLTCGEKRFNGNDGKDGDKKRDKDQTNMGHLWIGPPIYPGVQGLCAGFVSTSINGKQKKRSKKRTGTSEISRRAILQNDETEGRDAVGADECIGPVRKEETKDLSWVLSVQSERRAAEILCGPWIVLLACLLMCVDTDELPPQWSLCSHGPHCPYSSISFQNPRAYKGRFSSCAFSLFQAKLMPAKAEYTLTCHFLLHSPS